MCGMVNGHVAVLDAHRLNTMSPAVTLSYTLLFISSLRFYRFLYALCVHYSIKEILIVVGQQRYQTEGN